ncbi:ubiquitin-like protein 7 [Achroia grisella]|uniref:ubiquitin-like protein 7 n=1 Tax=Achroia grisella TaxID=688607 RepID=UPI0027D1F08E|nr:ubiquitin-like protein 7 [Achroia grisella]
METETCLFLGIKVKPGPLERYKVENFGLDNTVVHLKTEAEKKVNIPSTSLELIHHGKILKDDATLQDSGVKNGEMIHVLKKKAPVVLPSPPTYSDIELQQLNTSLRTLGCTPNAPGWTLAMQLVNDEASMREIMAHAPSLAEDSVLLSILHEVELLAALGANEQTMRRGVNAHPELPAALYHLIRLVRIWTGSPSLHENVAPPTSGFVYSLEALSEDEDAEEEDNEDSERNPITQEQLAAALQAATEAVSSSTPRGNGHESLVRLLQAAEQPTRSTSSVPETNTPTASGTNRTVITPEMFRDAIWDAIATNRGSSAREPTSTPMEQSTAASSSQSPAVRDEEYATQLHRMHEMGLLNDALNLRALLICSGDVNSAINLVFSGAIEDE